MCLSDIDHIMYDSACSMFTHVSYMYHTLSVHHAIVSETTNQLIVYSILESNSCGWCPNFTAYVMLVFPGLSRFLLEDIPVIVG